MVSRPEFSARHFGPGSSDGGTPVVLVWRDQWLVVRRGVEVIHTLRAVEVEPAARGFNNAQLALQWTIDDDRHMVVLDSAAAAAFREVSPPALQHRLQPVAAVQRRTERRFRWGIALLAVLALLPVAALGLVLAFADPLAGWVVDRIPPSVEARIGESVLAQTRAQGKLITAGPAHEALQTIGRRLAGPEESLQFFVADRPEVNAFAAPGGIVVVNGGLLSLADSAEEVAGVLAHEIAHVELRHGLRQMVKSAGIRVLLSLAAGDYGQLAGWGAQLSELKFSRDAEREADSRGLSRLVGAEIDPSGLGRFFAKLESVEGAGGALPAVLSTHPATEERKAALEAALVQLPPVAVRPLGIEWPAVRAALESPRP
ncbi:MAG: M48 family metallopeptidase [Zoogloeaceae bacterium]|nr:M48 family metallopeptidase [Zoogloeaceae bacterium]